MWPRARTKIRWSSARTRRCLAVTHFHTLVLILLRSLARPYLPGSGRRTTPTLLGGMIIGVSTGPMRVTPSKAIIAPSAARSVGPLFPRIRSQSGGTGDQAQVRDVPRQD